MAVAHSFSPALKIGSVVTIIIYFLKIFHEANFFGNILKWNGQEKHNHTHSTPKGWRLYTYCPYYFNSLLFQWEKTYIRVRRYKRAATLNKRLTRRRGTVTGWRREPALNTDRWISIERCKRGDTVFPVSVQSRRRKPGGGRLPSGAVAASV